MNNIDMDAVSLSIFSQRLSAVCDEMGASLCRAAFSPNIRDRFDYSCAVFDTAGRLAAQAAHIPVHLGSMAYALEHLVHRFDWQTGDMLVFNDPFFGGTHLPDVTVVAPVFANNVLIGFVANRAHHADLGATTPGGMPVSKHIKEEGMLIKPQYLVRDGKIDQLKLRELVARACNPSNEMGDYSAQVAANAVALSRLADIAIYMGIDAYAQGIKQVDAYGCRFARRLLAELPYGSWQFTDYLDSDGFGAVDIPIQIELTIQKDAVTIDFSGTSGMVAGNVNCPLSVTAAAVYYVFRSLLPMQTPACHGTFSVINLRVPDDCLVNASGNAAIAGGNVETSSRIVDCLLGAFAQALPDKIPAASQGTMNNIALGSIAEPGWSYYETIAGGCGASATQSGLTARQSHMTNTLNTPIEVLESQYPIRIRRYQVRHDSGGCGLHTGGNGIIREFEFLKQTTCTIISERRERAPWGLHGGEDGLPGRNLLNGEEIKAKTVIHAKPGDCLTIMTPGGGGWGK